MELLYHYLWKYKMTGANPETCDGRRVEILFPGIHNEDAGPDFSNVRLRLGGELWTGNIEIHVKASDWYKHGHDKNPAYDNIILHVVAIDDARIKRADGSEVPQMVMILPQNFYIAYSQLCADFKGLRCQSSLPGIPELNKIDWLESLSFERLHLKSQRILEWLHFTGNDWEQTMFIALARGLGFNLNGVPFEMLAKSIPLKYIYHHADNLMQIEAILFGQAGLLDSSRHIFDEYYQSLCREYMFLATKYGLRPMRRDLWKYARTRPHNFPHRRIALLAAALYSNKGFTTPILEAAGNADRLMDLFSWILHEYWCEHFDFGSDSRINYNSATLSGKSKELLLINVAAPFYFAYAQSSGLYEYGEKSIDVLSSLNPEKNSIVSKWETAGIRADNALRSQALIHLYNEYCEKGRCLDCRFGNYILRKER